MGLVSKYHNKYQTGGLQHLLASQIREEVGSHTFDTYFKFTIVRNPWDKVVSQYAYMSRREDLRDFIGMSPNASFKQYMDLIRGKTHVQWQQQVSFISDSEGRRLVDYVGRFEAFRESVEHILTALGIPICPIPHQMRGARDPYPEYYDDESREMVASMYATDIATFGYSFLGQSTRG